MIDLPYSLTIEATEEPEDYNDLRMLREAKESEKDKQSVSLKDAKKLLNID